MLKLHSYITIIWYKHFIVVYRIISKYMIDFYLKGDQKNIPCVDWESYIDILILRVFYNQ